MRCECSQSHGTHGCRLGEAIALQPGDLDFNGGFIQIRRNFTNGRLTTPKNGKSRRVDMSARLAVVLKQHLVDHELEALGKDRSKPQWVFCNEVGAMLDADNLRHRVFYKLLERVGLRRIRLHDLRHTFATRLLMNGESPAYVKEQLGHSSIQVTVDLYSHWIPGSNRQAVDRLDEGVNIPKTEGQSATKGRTIRQEMTDSRQKSLNVLEPASRIERATRHRFGSEAYLTDSYEGGQTKTLDGLSGGDHAERLRLMSRRNAQARFGAGDPD